MITRHELDVLEHTSRTGRYVTDEASVLDMAKRGLLLDYGEQRLADGMHYFTLSQKGRALLNEHDKNLCRFPQPKPKRPASEQFAAWRNYCDACQHTSFSVFLKEVWPFRRSYL